MPIVGLTTNRVLMPPIVATAKKGDPKGEKRPGRDRDSFRLVSSPPSREVDKALLEVYGREPRRIKVLLPNDDPDLVFPAFNEEWTAGGLVHKCDTEYVYEIDRATNRWVKTRVPCPYGPMAKSPKSRTRTNPGCRQVGRLHTIPMDLVEAGIYGTMVFNTHGTHDIAHLSGALQEFRQRFGALTNVPFIVYRANKKISTPDGKGGRVRRDKSLVFLRPLAEFMGEAMQALVDNGPALLNAPEEDIIEGEAVEIATCSVEGCGVSLKPETLEAFERMGRDPLCKTHYEESKEVA